jgi:hypothetical protein
VTGRFSSRNDIRKETREKNELRRLSQKH